MDDKIQGGPRAEHIHDQKNMSGDEKADYGGDHLRQLTPEELIVEKKLKRKVDFRIMPLTVLIYLMNYIDR